jgi:hypothetical protein
MSTIAIYACYASYGQPTSVLNIEKNPGFTNTITSSRVKLSLAYTYIYTWTCQTCREDQNPDNSNATLQNFICKHTIDLDNVQRNKKKEEFTRQSS